MASQLAERVRDARAAGTALRIRGGATRTFLRGDADREATELDLRPHRGVIAFEPSELVLTVRAGTPLEEIEATLSEAGQMLPFEPPRFGSGSTIGGVVASGISGPARPWQGAVRDAVLGVTVLDGHGAVGRFGGQVMKNVAGYDISRLNAGAMGALGVLLDISLRLAPRPEADATCVLELGLGRALERMTELARRPLPVTGIAWVDGLLRVRLAGTEAAVAAAVAAVGGDTATGDAAWWRSLRDAALPFFDAASADAASADATGALWRLSLPANAPQPELAANWLLDWGGAQRFCITDAPAEDVFDAAAALGGHATRWRPEVLRMPLPQATAALQRRIKAVFDPDGILNPGVLSGEGF